ncbi:MAG: hypothetical protein AAF340_08210 [Pseudomonadota bacterium]
MRTLILAFAVVATPAVSCGIGEYEVFDCAISGGKKQLRLCTTEQAAIYRFGKTGNAPELELFAPIERFDYRPWNGIGRTLYEQVTFTNQSYGYTVYGVFDRLAEEGNADLEGGVIVTDAGAEIAHLTCDAGSVTARMDLFYELKTRAGQCWDIQNLLWTTDCPVD